MGRRTASSNKSVPASNHHTLCRAKPLHRQQANCERVLLSRLPDQQQPHPQKNPPRMDNLKERVEAYNPKNRHKRQPTWNPTQPRRPLAQLHLRRTHHPRQNQPRPLLAQGQKPNRPSQAPPSLLHPHPSRPLQPRLGHRLQTRHGKAHLFHRRNQRRSILYAAKRNRKIQDRLRPQILRQNLIRPSPLRYGHQLLKADGVGEVESYPHNPTDSGSQIWQPYAHAFYRIECLIPPPTSPKPPKPATSNSASSSPTHR